ncbi:uncharacterized protein F5891DRAFT_1129849 [Suillus fuscotomentosus]|uniref:CxC2-like cysteine cluster KDZ transposase-associated domain-containing protein n=1 Tax=Suillus fuscotomentosus TaxID=1912939 RepID=A0AAD4HIF3_9AGAM|nr:uncharacterized protein F5891DRAFT_1129849 [Suillus fuscotomentosus]KAG1897763.1 hypothetical protein F5891DRAFT_1129849 [Suillus fuscotomentosus]
MFHGKKQILSMKTMTTQNDFLREYLPWRNEYLLVLLELEQLINNGKCKDCGREEGFICCLSCSGEHSWCSSCAVKAHQHNPFHNLQLWNGKFYESNTLWDHSNLGAMEDVFAHMEGDTIYETQLGLSNLVIVHSTGVYSHCVSWCQCPEAEKDRHLHLLKAKLFPASITRPQSAFTFDVLDNFLIDALECKTSAMSFYQKLRCFTNNAFPHTIPDHYRELMRVSRIWRDLVNRIRFGFAHESDRSPGPGDLALYCPACPQPGINLPFSWKDTYDSWLVMQRYIVDGNFTAQHMKMKTPEDDVSLADGKGYMVTEGPYETHIIESVEEKEKSSCSNHHAVNAANVQRSNLRATGVGATACARHGCFVPHAVVDFQKGESIHFYERVNQSYHLSLPQSIKILPAIGKFHLSTHKLLCFPRFSLNFITGAGHIDGKILETLWAPFNKISPTARSMTLSHRQEVLDDHMRDSNWKKLVRIGKYPLFPRCQL